MSNIKTKTTSGNTFSFDVLDAITSINDVAWFDRYTKEGWVLDKPSIGDEKSELAGTDHSNYEVLAKHADPYGNTYYYLRLRTKSAAEEEAAEKGDPIDQLLDIAHKVISGPHVYTGHKMINRPDEPGHPQDLEDPWGAEGDGITKLADVLGEDPELTGRVVAEKDKDAIKESNRWISSGKTINLG